MANPNAMKEAFIKYNLDKIVYSEDASPPPKDAEDDLGVSPRSSTAAVPLNTSSDQVLIASYRSREFKDAIKIKNFNERLDTSELTTSLPDGSRTATVAKSQAVSMHYNKARESGKRKLVTLVHEDAFSPVDQKTRPYTTKNQQTKSMRLSKRFRGRGVG